MIQVYGPSNTDYESNGDAVLCPTVCEIDTEAWELKIDHPRDPEGRWKLIEDGAVIKAPSFLPDDQLFRIVTHEKSDEGVSATAHPIFFDSANDCMLTDVRPTDKTGQQALDIMTQGTRYSGYSDIDKVSTAYYVMRNLHEALTGDDENSFINRWGGEVMYDNFSVVINTRLGADRGVEIRYGKNIPENGMSVEVDSTEVVTRIYPKAFNGRMMSGKGYVDSELIESYPIVHQRVIEFDDVKLADDADEGDEEDDGIIVCADQEELDDVLRERCDERYAEGVDRPKVTIKCDMVLLQNTIEYANLKDLETVSLGDTVHCINAELGIDTEARVSSLVYDCIKKRVSSVVIGSQEYNYFKDTSSVIDAASSVIDTTSGTVMANRVAGVMNMLYVSLRAQKDIAQTQDVRAMLFEDLDPQSPTFGALSIGTVGIQIAHERTADGLDWQWGTAIDFQSIVADYIITGILTDRSGNFYLNLDTGELHMKDGTFIGTITAGSVGGWSINESGLYNGKVKIKNDGVTNIYTWADLGIMQLLITKQITLSGDGVTDHYDLNGDGQVTAADYVTLANRLTALDVDTEEVNT